MDDETKAYLDAMMAGLTARHDALMARMNDQHERLLDTISGLRADFQNTSGMDRT